MTQRNSGLDKQHTILLKDYLLRSAKGFRESLDGIAMVDDEHDRYTRNLENAALQVLIAGGDNIATVLRMSDSRKTTTVLTRSTRQSSA